MVKLKEHIYEFDEILIGLTVQSLLYSYIYNLPIIYKFKNRPRFFEFIDNSVNLTKLGIMKENKILTTPSGDIVKSYSKIKMLDHLFFIQSLSGRIPFRDDVAGIELSETLNLLKITTENQKIFKYKFNKLRIFDTRGLTFLTPSGEIKEKVYILDEFKIKIRNNNWYHMISTKSDFPKKIYISADKKKLMAHSMLTVQEMHLPEYSSFYITKQTERILEKNSIKSNLEWIKRHVEDKDQSEYVPSDNIIIDKRDEEEIWKEKKVSMYPTWLGSFRFKMVQRMMDTLGQTP